ncbi:MAG: hypothetical protein WDZ93_01080 [Candidatus Paceibacterota bacterium]
MNWIFLAAGAQFLNAIVAILDKFIVSDERMLPRPFVYAFYSCLVTSTWGVVYFFGYIPFLAGLGAPQFANVQTPTIQVVGMSFLAAYTFFMAIVSMYDGLKRADASDVMPVIGAVSAIATFMMAYVFLDVRLTENFIWGIALLATGTFLVSQIRFTRQLVLNTFHSGLFFALHYIAMKGLFQETSFDDGFFWSRVGFVLFALSLLLVPVYFQKIKEQTKVTSKKAGAFVLMTKVVAGVAAFLLLKATDWGDVAVVQALDGLKFVFILLIGIFVGKYLPVSAGEKEVQTKTFVRKVLYVAIISIGFIILFT